MDVDPPVPPSSASKKISKSVKKPKFTPKPPVTRRRALILPKSGSSDDDSESDQKVLRQFIGRRLRSGASKVEKKSSDNAAVSHGAGSSRANDPPKKEKEGNSKNSSNLKEMSEKSVMFSSSTAKKDEDVHHMLVHDDSRSSSDSENEYKEPWDPHSYYPISLPLRPPGSGNPEVLNAEEFGRQDEYEETKVNSALELGLSGSVDDDEKHVILFQFPEQLPLDRAPVSLKGKEKTTSSSSFKDDGSNKRSDLNDLSNGCMGKMLVYKSGAIKLKLGDNIFDVSSGTPRGFDRSVAMMNTKSKDCCVLARVDKQAIVTPDIDSILENISQL